MFMLGFFNDVIGFIYVFSVANIISIAYFDRSGPWCLRHRFSEPFYFDIGGTNVS